MKRSSVFLINGGAGRIICSIPAFELYEIENPDDDFIIIVQYGLEFFKGHPSLYKRCYDFNHRNLFEDKIKDRIYKNPEPYHVWEYYNCKASIAQAFDIAINDKGLRPLSCPTINLSNDEQYGASSTMHQIKTDRGNKKTIVFQPFGRGTNLNNSNQINLDSFGKSFLIDDVIKIINELQKKYIVILMTEEEIKFEKLGYNNVNVAQIPGLPLRHWFAIISTADYFLGCDSVGQHAAYALGRKATVVLSSTFKENVSYPLHPNFDIIDFGENIRVYSPIRLCHDDIADLNNEKIMRLTQDQLDIVVNSVNTNI